MPPIRPKSRADPLEADQCALVVVDIQEKLLPPIFNKEALVKNSQLLIRLAKILDLPVMVTTQYSKGLGATVPEIASLLERVTAIRQAGVQLLRQRSVPLAPEGAAGQSQHRACCAGWKRTSA